MDEQKGEQDVAQNSFAYDSTLVLSNISYCLLGQGPLHSNSRLIICPSRAVVMAFGGRGSVVNPVNQPLHYESTQYRADVTHKSQTMNWPTDSSPSKPERRGHASGIFSAPPNTLTQFHLILTYLQTGKTN